MESILAESSRFYLAVYCSLAVALALMASAPNRVRKRVRTCLVLGLVFVVAHLALPRLFPHLHGTIDIRVVTYVVGAIILVWVPFVLVVDVLFPKLRGAPINELVRGLLFSGFAAFIVFSALRAAGVQATSLLATGTVVTAILGLSLQDTLGNLFAGLAIRIDENVDEGDWVRLDKGDVVGRIQTMNWRAVSVVADDRTTLVIPNNVFARTPFTNYSKPVGGGVRRSLFVVTPFDVSPTQVTEALLDACDDCELVREEPAPSVQVKSFTDRGVEYWLRYWIADFSQRDPANHEVSTHVWYALHRRKIPFALPVTHEYHHRINQEELAREQAEVVRDRRAVIEGVDFLRPLPEAAKQLLSERGRRKLFAPGEIVLKEGDKGRSFYVIRRGTAVAVVGGKEVERMGPGQFFGEMALLTGEPRRATVRAHAELEVLEIDQVAFNEILKADPHLAEKVSEVIGARDTEYRAVQEAGSRPSFHEIVSWKAEVLDRIRKMFGLD